MINKYFNIVLSAVFVMSLGMCVVSCSDDDKNNSENPGGGDGEKTEAELEQEALGWTLITQLTDERKAPEGWENMTFEPTIGSAVEGDPYTRVVATNTMESAATRFAELAGDPPGFSEATTSYTYTIEGIGSLSYQRGSESDQYLAQVTVDLKHVPHLKKILYQTFEQRGNNGKFDGAAYYRFGDVVMDGEGYYWICVRPAFGKEYKQDSHWLCLSRTLPDKNLEAYKTSTGNQNYLPTGLGSSTKHMQNGAEMFYAMLHPDDWHNNLSGSPKPDMFDDFSTKNYQYHNIYFWQRVCKAWQDQDLFGRVLGVSKAQLDGGLANGLHFLYCGYTWWWKTSWKCYLYEAVYKNGTGKKSNMHDATTSKPKKDMHDIIVDAKTGDKVGTVNGKFFDNDNAVRWYVRYKTGEQLSSNGNYNEKTAISGVQEVYVYNKLHGIDLNEDPEITVKDAEDDATMFGYFIPGTIMKESDGTRWLCYYSWFDENGTGQFEKKKAKFISFDNIQTATETISNASGDNANGTFVVNSDLIPESEIPFLAFFLANYSASSSTFEANFRAAVGEYLNVSLKDLFSDRDTIHVYPEGESIGHLRAVNFAYTPTGGRTKGTQPYMRYVNDGSHVGSLRTVDKEAYWRNMSYKRYHTENGGTLDLVDLFSAYNRITEPVNGDKWSQAKRNGTNYRDRDFTKDDLYSGAFDCRKFFYDVTAGKWPELVTKNGYSRSKYVSPYWDPVIFIRFMEVDDTSTEFKGTYGGRRFTLLRETAENEHLPAVVNLTNNLSVINDYSWMDDVKISVKP